MSSPNNNKTRRRRRRRQSSRRSPLLVTTAAIFLASSGLPSFCLLVSASEGLSHASTNSTRIEHATIENLQEESNAERMKEPLPEASDSTAADTGDESQEHVAQDEDQDGVHHPQQDDESTNTAAETHHHAVPVVTTRLETEEETATKDSSIIPNTDQDDNLDSTILSSSTSSCISYCEGSEQQDEDDVEEHLNEETIDTMAETTAETAADSNDDVKQENAADASVSEEPKETESNESVGEASVSESESEQNSIVDDDAASTSEAATETISSEDLGEACTSSTDPDASVHSEEKQDSQESDNDSSSTSNETTKEEASQESAQNDEASTSDTSRITNQKAVDDDDDDSVMDLDEKDKAAPVEVPGNATTETHPEDKKKSAINDADAKDESTIDKGEESADEKVAATSAADKTDDNKPAPKGSLASFFEKAQSKSSTTNSFTEQLETQETISLLHSKTAPRRIDEKATAPSSDTPQYRGTPWGYFYPTRRLPDLQLLYLLFHGMNNKPTPGTSEVQQMLAELQNNPLFDADLVAELETDGENGWNLYGKEQVDADSIEAAEESDSESPSKSATSPQSSTTADANSDFVEGLDDIDKFFEGVDPPDELDVGASGTSIQEVLMGKGKQILVKKLLQLSHGVKRGWKSLSTSAKKLFSRDKESDAATDSREHFNLQDLPKKIWEVGKLGAERIMNFVDMVLDYFEKDDEGEEEILDFGSAIE